MTRITSTFIAYVQEFPRKHLFAMGIVACFMLFTLLLLPSENVEAKRIQIPVPLTIDAELKPIDQAVQTATVTEEVLDIPANPIYTKEITIKSGDNLSTAFNRAGISASTLHKIIHSKGVDRSIKKIFPGDKILFDFDEASNDLVKIRFPKSVFKTVEISQINKQYVSDVVNIEPEVLPTFKAATINNSFYIDAKNAGLSDNKIMDLANIFGWDVDFALDIRQGDSFSVIYEERFLDGKKVEDGNIIAAQFTNRGKTFTAIAYTDKNGHSHFYTPEGYSMRKAFIRTPVDFARVSSSFNPRRLHPILKTVRPHRGIDYAAKPGTPIKATGDGKIVHRGWKGGYGKTIVIQHGKRYTTLYAHMRAYKKGFKVGSKVKQGQIIGFVGSTGRSTGPHLHYEFRVDRIHRNPATVKFPNAEPIHKSLLAKYKTHAEQVMAQLTTYSNTYYAQLSEQETTNQ